MIKVGVIFGGESVEHEVSIISAVQAMNKLDANKYDIVPIYITKEGEWYTGAALKDIEIYQDLELLKRYTKNVVLYFNKGRYILQNKGFFKTIVNEIDIAFPIVHGTNVEDGVLQGYLKTIKIPFVGSGVCASSVAQDKVLQKQIWKDCDLPLTKYVWFYDSLYHDDKEEVLKKVSKLKYPVIVKPATLGSSVGITSVKSKDELEQAIENAIVYDNKIIVEEMVQNLTEVNISVLGNSDKQEVSELEQVISENDFLTYEDKYIGRGKKSGGSKGMLSANRLIPSNIDSNMKEEVKDIAVRAFQALGSSGVVRIDFLIDLKKKKVYINEINSIPGSLSFYLWEPVGKKYSELLDDMINIAIKDYKKEESKTKSFKTNILQGFGLKGSKGLKGFKGKL